MKRTNKKYLSSFMAMILFASTMTISSVPTVTALAATDTNGHWAESTINKWTASGYISGYPDGTFRPNNAISRAEFVTLANKAFSYNVPTSISFKDLDTSHWAYSEIQKGVSAGYIKGDAAGTFRPGAAVTRQEAAVMMAQIKQLQQNANSALSYTDYNSIANWAKPYVGAVSNVKIMQGFPNGAFRPQTSMTRAEAVTALENAIFAPTQSSNQPSSSVTTPNYNTNTSTNTNSSSNSSNSSNSTSASDYTLEDASLRNRTIDGNLIISSSLGSKDVTLNNVTVKGTVKIQGGSTIKAQSCDFSKVEMDKSGVTLNASNNTKIRNLEYLQRGKIEGSGYENVYVQDSSLSEATVDATVKYLELDTDANLKLYKNADVATLEVTSDAKDGEVTFTSGAEVDDMTIRGRIRIYGKGDINDMTTYVSGIRSSIKPDRVTTRGDGEKPSYSSGESGSSSSSSGSDYDDLTLDREDRTYDEDGDRFHNVSIEADGVTLRDAIVYNRLTITRDVEDGEVILDDVRVRGDVYIYGGGENSVIFRNCDIQGDIISYKDTDDSRYGDEPVALEFEDDTDVDGDIKVRGDTIIRAESDIKLGNVIVDRKLNEDLIVDAKINTLKLVADVDVRITGRSRIDKVDINSNRDITLRMESGSYIDTIDSNSDLTIRGNGTVKTIRTSKTVTTDSGIVNDDQTSTFVAVTDIVGIPSTQSSYSLTLSPSVQPTNASYQTVKWRIDGLNTAGASISDDRVVTATKDGQVRLLATIDNGKAIGTAYTKSFTVTFSSGSGTVTPPEPSTSATVKSISVSPDITSYAKDQEIKLTANIEGTLAKDEEVTWESSDPDIVKVEKKSTDGRDATATVLKYGAKTVTITAKVGTEAGKTKEIKVSAAPLPNITGVVVKGENNAKPEAAKVNDEFTLTATITDYNGEAVEWRVIEDGGTTTSNLVELAASESETTTNSTTVKIKSQKESNTPLTVQARMKGTDNEWKSSTTKIVVLGSGGGSSANPPAETGSLSEITPTTASVVVNGTLELSVTLENVTDTTSYSLDWSVNNGNATLPSTKITTFDTNKVTKITLTGATAGTAIVTATLKKNGTAVTPAVEKTRTVTVTANPPAETGSLSEITPTTASVAVNDTLELSVTLENVTDTTSYSVDWSVNNGNATLPSTKITTFDTNKVTKITLTGATAGTATVTATLRKNGTAVTPAVEKTRTVTVTANPPENTVALSEITADRERLNVYAGNAGTVSVSIPSDVENISDYSVYWEISSTDGAKVVFVPSASSGQTSVTTSFGNGSSSYGENETVVPFTAEQSSGSPVVYVGTAGEVTVTATLKKGDKTIGSSVTKNIRVDVPELGDIAINGNAPALDVADENGKTLSVNVTGIGNERDYTVHWSIERVSGDIPLYGAGKFLDENSNAVETLTTSFSDNITEATIKGTSEGEIKAIAELYVMDNLMGTEEREIVHAPSIKKEISLTVNDSSIIPSRQAAPRRMEAAPQTQTAVEKPYVIDITLPTQECEAGKNFDLSQAQLQAAGENNFNISWIVGRGYADMPDDTTVRMDRTGSVVMTAVVVDGKADGDVYTKDFEITFTEPKVEPVPVQKEEIPEVPVQKEEIPEVPVQKEEIPEVPVQKEEIPEVPVQKEETPIVPVQPEEIPAVPVQPEEIPAVPAQPEETPAVPVQPEDKSIVISTKGELMTNNEIVLYAKNADGTGTNYQNAVWSIVKDDGTNSVIEKNVLTAKNTGTVVIKVTIGHGIPRIRTKVIEIAQ